MEEKKREKDGKYYKLSCVCERYGFRSCHLKGGREEIMNQKSVINIIIFLFIGIACIAGVSFYIKTRGTPDKVLDKSAVKKESLGKWREKQDKLIGEGKADIALSGIEKKMLDFPNGDPGLMFVLYELKGDALLKLNRCNEAVQSFQTAIQNLANARFAFFPKRSEEPMGNDERSSLNATLNQKLSQANACAK